LVVQQFSIRNETKAR